MINKPLIAGIVGFLAGGLLVSIAASTFDKPASHAESDNMSMTQMADSLRPLKGADFDKAFIEHMIDHHEGAIAMAKLAETNAQHHELKQLGKDIISAQSKEIDMMRSWQHDWAH
jgi:uncharacterized protein (DUF305 family)